MKTTNQSVATSVIVLGVLALLLGVAVVVVIAQQGGKATVVKKSKKLTAIEELAVADFERIGVLGDATVLRSAPLEDCLIWSADPKLTKKVKDQYPEYFRPTKLRGTAVLLSAEASGQKITMASLVSDDGEVVNVINGENIKLSGGRAARKAGAPTTNGITPDADPLKDKVRNSR